MQQIDANKFYSMKEVVDGGLIPFSKPLIVKQIERGFLKASAFGAGKGRRYKIKGSNIIEFLVKLEDGSFY